MRNGSLVRNLVVFFSAIAPMSALVAQTSPSSPPDITTWQVNLQHTGNNANETILTPANISSPGNFGLLFTQVLDGQTYGQPLFVSVATLSKLPGDFSDGKAHNVVYVATQHNSIYAFDGDADPLGANPNGTNSSPLWKTNLTPAGATTVPQGDTGSSDIGVELGITATPVIDTTTGTIYVVAKIKNPSASPTHYQQFLHALDLKTGKDKPGSPVLLDSTTVSFDGTPDPGASSSDLDPVTAPAGKIPFSALHQHLRSALALSNGVLYLAYASHSDTRPYYGEILGFDATTLKLVKTFIATPNGGAVYGSASDQHNATGQAGIWQSGASLAFDTSGSNMYFATGNGAWDQNGATADWGESILKLPTDTVGPIQISQQDIMNYFTPSAWEQLNDGVSNGPGPDRDLGGGGMLLLPDQPGGHTHLMAGGGKAGTLYLLDRDSLGGIVDGDQNAIQEITEPNTNSLFVTPSYFNGSIYYAPAGNPIERRTLQLDAINNVVKFSDPPQTSGSNDTYAGKGAHVFISSNGTTNGIVWALKSSLQAYDATNLSNVLFSARTNVPGATGSNAGCTTAKFTVPTVANGKVYYTCFSNTNQGYLFVSGLFPPAAGTPQAPTSLTAQGSSSSQITLNWTNNVPTGTAFAGFKINRSTSASGPFNTLAGQTSSDVSSFTDTNLSPGTTYFYQVVSFNSNGSSLNSNVASGTTFPVFSPTGLVAYWAMDDGPNATSVADVTGNGHTAAIPSRDEAVFFPQGYIGGAWSFHGTQSTDELVVSDHPALQFTAAQSFTLSAWIKVDNLTGAEQPVIVKSAGTASPYGILVNSANRWVVRGALGDIVGPAVTQSVWTNIALVQDASKNIRYLYVNGVQQPQTAPAQAANSAGDLIMGEQTINGVVAGYQGEIDDARLYNIALAPDAVTGVLAPPVLEASSLQTQGSAGTFGITLYPGTAAQVESRVGSIPGSYSIALHFPVPVTGISATLGVQTGSTQTAVGQVASVTYDSTQTVATVALTGVQNVQALNLHLAGIVAVNDMPGKEVGVPVAIPGTADIPFNLLEGDVTGDRKVDQFDLNLVTSKVGGLPVTQSNAFMDVNSDGLINDQDVAIVNGQSGQSLSVQTDANLALFKTAFPSDPPNGGNTGAMAFDGIANENSRWESPQGHDPESLYVDLGASAQIDSVDIDWENASAKNYVLEYSNDQTAPPVTWLPFATITNNPGGGGDVVSFPQTAPAIGRFVRMTGTARNTTFGYSIEEFRVNGFFVSGSNTNPNQGTAPSITSQATASGVVGSAFSYQITGSQTPTTFGATGLPAGLSVSSTGLISGIPTTAGTTSATISASNAAGSGSLTLTITISAPALQPPANFSAVGGSGLVNLSWSASPGATAYAIYRGTTQGGEAGTALVPSIASTSFTDTTVTGATTYYYFVKAINSAGSSAPSNEASATATLAAVIPAPPTGLTAVSGNSIATLTWNPSNGAVSYNVLRGTTAGGENPAAIVSNLATTAFTDTTVTNGTTYFYKVAAINVAGVSGLSNEASATPAIPQNNPEVAIYQIDSGSTSGVGSFSADQDNFVSGGSLSSTNNVVTTAGVPNAAPPQVYQTNRFGSFTYTLPALSPGGNYTVLLHFAETYWTAANKRVFDVVINNQTVLPAFDIFAKAGGANIAVVEPITAIADSKGQISISFVPGANGVDNPQVNGIEVLSNGGTMPLPATPAELSYTNGNKQVSLSWIPGAGPAGVYDVFRGTAAGAEANTPIASGIAGTHFIDTTVTNLSRYFYIVKARNSAGVSSSSNEINVVPGAPLSGTPVYQIAAGSTTAGTSIAPFTIDADFTGGNNSATGNAIDTTPVISPAPNAVYQHERSGGTFSYTFPNLTPGEQYTVRLHFAEFYWTSTGQRVFNVAINGLTVLPNFDIVATAGAANKAVVEQFPAIADSTGSITISYSPGAADQPKASGIEIYKK